MFWKDNVLSKLGENLLINIDGCQIQLDKNDWHYIHISKNGKVENKYQLTIVIPENINGIITGIRLLGYGTVIGEKTEYIVKKPDKAMILRLKFQIYERSEK